METVNDLVYGQNMNHQCPTMGAFINASKECFKTGEDNFNIGVEPLLVLPLDAPVMLADGYKELGLWIPSNSKEDPFTGILLAWADEIYPTPSGVQYVYLSQDGYVVMCREVIPYTHLMHTTAETILTTFII